MDLWGCLGICRQIDQRRDHNVLNSMAQSRPPLIF
jgi:hypothetical protein